VTCDPKFVVGGRGNCEIYGRKAFQYDSGCMSHRKVCDTIERFKRKWMNLVDDVNYEQPSVVTYIEVMQQIDLRLWNNQGTKNYF
jgi:hypothetical protein